jgi:hypothetical protein
MLYQTNYLIVATLRNSRAGIFSIAGEAKTGCSLTGFGVVVVIGAVPLILNIVDVPSIYVSTGKFIHSWQSVYLPTYLPS